MEKAFKLDFENDKAGSLYVNCCGCSRTEGLHSFGEATYSSASAPHRAEAEATFAPPSRSVTSNRSPGCVPHAAAATRNVRRSRSGVATTLRIYCCGTASSHTVCQIPVTGVYQMTSGLFTCLPRGWQPASVGSQTRTRSVLTPFCSAGVTSKSNGV